MQKQRTSKCETNRTRENVIINTFTLSEKPQNPASGFCHIHYQITTERHSAGETFSKNVLTDFTYLATKKVDF
jgi:hypothetical protein